MDSGIILDEIKRRVNLINDEYLGEKKLYFSFGFLSYEDDEAEEMVELVRFNSSKNISHFLGALVICLKNLKGENFLKDTFIDGVSLDKDLLKVGKRYLNKQVEAFNNYLDETKYVAELELSDTWKNGMYLWILKLDNKHHAPIFHAKDHKSISEFLAAFFILYDFIHKKTQVNE